MRKEFKLVKIKDIVHFLKIISSFFSLGFNMLWNSRYSGFSLIGKNIFFKLYSTNISWSEKKWSWYNVKVLTMSNKNTVTYWTRNSRSRHSDFLGPDSILLPPEKELKALSLSHRVWLYIREMENYNSIQSVKQLSFLD